MTQKSIIGYSTVKTKLPVHELLKEKQFADAYTVATWDSYVAVLADLMEVALSYLRAANEANGHVFAARLGDFYESLIAAHPLPAHRTETGWTQIVVDLRRRLDASLASPRRPIKEISGQSAQELFAKLPFHPRLSGPDGPAVTANVQFLMVGLAHEFDRIDFAAMGAQIAAHGSS